MGIVSLTNTDKLYWLGRYSERVYTTIRLFGESFDHLIEGEVQSIGAFCASLNIPQSLHVGRRLRGAVSV